MKKTLALVLTLILLTLACSFFETPVAPEIDPNRIGTMVALTTEAILTQSVPEVPPPTAPPPPTAIPTLTDEEAIKQALLAKLGWTAAEMEFSIGPNTGSLAQGTVKKVNEMSGAAWFAGKDNSGKWIVSYIGQGIPYCSEIQAFNFPTDWISHCVDASENTVAR